MKAKLQLILTMLAWIAFFHRAPAQTTLSIAPAVNQLVLYWPTSLTNYDVQSTTNPATPSWMTVSNAVLVTVSNTVPVTAFTVTNFPPANFFRLIQNTNTPATTPDGMALVPAGSFTMGDTLDGDANAVPVSVTVSAFYIDQHDVTLALWQQVYNWATNHGYDFDNAGSGKASNHPVQTIDWYDAVKWCNARSEMDSRTPAYYVDATQASVYRTGDLDLTAASVNWNSGYRLPTEAEWEKAARGGASGLRFPWGNTISESQANYTGDTNDYSYDLGPNGQNRNFDTGANPHTSPVDYFAQNGYQLYDMAGNVWQYCWDWYAPTPYPTGSPYLGGTDPHGPASSPRGTRVGRGGSWNSSPAGLRCAYRNPNGAPAPGSIVFGFRCVRAL